MVEIAELTKQNSWWADANSINSDPKIIDFESAKVKWVPRIKKYIPLDKDALLSLRGPRQVGKTTLMKLIIREELKHRKPSDIFYFTCELVTKAETLKDILETYLQWSQRQSQERKLIILDEISRVKDWEIALKYIIDVYSLKGKTFILTGSSSWDLKHSVERLPGRKGEVNVDQNHRILLPMKFAEYVELRAPKVYENFRALGLAENKTRKEAFLELIGGKAERWLDAMQPHLPVLETIFDEYLLTGGVIGPINELESKGEIRNSIYELYLQFFFGDLAGLMREETTAKKILSAVIKHQGKPIGWTKIARETDINSSITVSQYCDILKNLFILNVYSAFDQNTRSPKHRSERKLQIPNPFFFHAIRSYVQNPAANYFKEAEQFLQTSEGKALLAEFVCGDHLSRLAYNFAPSDLFDQSDYVFYSRTKSGEVIDFIVRIGSEFIPVEVKYQNKINPSDFKHIKKFKYGIIATKNYTFVDGRYVAIPLPMLLLFV
jgi:predicted AAA+ superfamily ATPase